METIKNKRFKVIVIALLLLSLIMNGYMFWRVSSINATKINYKNKVENIQHNINSNITEMVKKVTNSVVGVEVYSHNQVSGSGSGVIYEAQGNTAYIITNHHVINGASQLEIVFANKERAEAQLIGSDQFSDIALLKVKTDFEPEPIKIGNSDLLKKGETVLAIGSPLGIQYAGTVTQGIVSATDRTVSVDVNGSGQSNWDVNAIQTDAAINPGNSGGAFVNAVGELVGITSMKFSAPSVEGIGFALPINNVMKDIKEIRETGKVNRPVIGIRGASISGLSRYELRYYGIETTLEDGIYVASVENGGAGAKAGIKQGDIIIKIDNLDVTTYKSFLAELYSKRPGDTVKIVVEREGKKKNIDIKLG